MKFEGIRLLVEDFDKAFNFYHNTLGFDIVWGKPGDAYASFEVSPNTSLSIFKAGLMDESIDQSPVGLRRAKDNSVLIFSVLDLDPIYKDLQEKKVPILKEPTPRPGWGCITLHIRDTEGNLIEFNAPLEKTSWDKDLIEDAKNYEK